MPYSYKLIPENEREIHHYSSESSTNYPGIDLQEMEQYEILDPDGDGLCVVHSEGEVESLVSHLNR